MGLTLIALAGITYPFRDVLYLGISGITAQSPVLSAIASFVTEPGLVLLVLTTVWIAVRSWLYDRFAFWRLVAGGVGVILAYGMSELLKLIVTEERPCRALDAMTVVACPELSDWSWPSNHSVIAAAFATACILAVPRLSWYAAPAALLIALSRVAVGAHYVHDVLSGLALGMAVALMCVSTISPLARHLPGKFTLNRS